MIFTWFMRNAAALLLIIALLLAFGPIVVTIGHIMSVANGPGSINGGMADGNFALRELWLNQIFLSLKSAALPLFGAALLWRLDRRWGETGRAAE